MATPLEWLNEFQVNTGAAATGGQDEPVIIGLSNGNFLVAWEEAADGAIGTTAGRDIVGKIYDAEGGLVRDSFRLNNDRNIDDEQEFDVAATNDGGFVLAYVDDDISSPNLSAIYWERFDSAGDVLTGAQGGGQITSENATGGNFSNVNVAVDLDNNDFVVTWTDPTTGSSDVNGSFVDAGTGTESAVFDAAQNGSVDFDRRGDLAILANGNYVQVYEEEDGTNTSIEMQIFSANGTGGTDIALVSNINDGNDPAVASLLNGNFVVVWETDTDDIQFQIRDATGGIVRNTTTAAGGTDSQNEPEVVALPDGGFVIVWDDDTENTVEARAFFADGNVDGAQFQVENNNAFAPNVGVTADGRILFTYEQNGGSGEVFASIWDPRENPIDAADYDFFSEDNFVENDGPVTAQKNLDTTLNGNSLTVTLLGQNGDDTITGGFATQTIEGGGGNDTIVILDGQFIDNVDGGTGTDTLDMTDVTTRIVVDLPGNTYEGSVVGDSPRSLTNVEIILSGSGDDELISDGSGTIDAGAGNDLVFAGLGLPETLIGGTGIDTLDTTTFNGDYVVNLVTGDTNFTGESFTGFENLISGNGDDTLTGTGGANEIRGGGGNDTIDTGSGGDTLFGEGGNDTLFGGLSTDTISGGSGDDRIVIRNGEFIDNVDGGTGIDLIDVSDETTNGVTVDLGAVANNFDGLGPTTDVRNVENFTGTQVSDTIIGSNGANVLRGEGGNDTLDGLGGNDVIGGGAGNDSVLGGAGDDIIDGGANNDLLSGQDGFDTIRGGGGDDTIDGGDDNDRLFGEAGDDTIDGGIGIDVIVGDVGEDTLRGRQNNDRIRGGDEADTLEGGGGNDKLNGQGGNDLIIGGPGRDIINGRGGRDELFGEVGDDVIRGGLGGDRLTGGTGDDVFEIRRPNFSEPGARDLVLDFEGAGAAVGDLFDLSRIDADVTTGGDDAFTFITAGALGTGQLRVVDFTNGRSLVQGNIDADGTAELEILIDDGAVTASQYTAADFIL